MFNIPEWFFEKTPFGKSHTLGVKIKERLLATHSDFQEIEIYDTVEFGRMLVLDGVIQVTEFDEFAYHEMFVHVPMCSHPNPKSALVIGGGDGGMVRELVKWDCLERIDMCEIDKGVVDAAFEFMPFTASGLKDPRVTLYYEDGAKFVREHQGEYDLVLTDSSDPIGPAEVLFERPFYEGLCMALKPDGVAVSQCETFYFYLPVIKGLVDVVKDIYPRLQYLNTLVPTYPSGMIGLLFCSKSAKADYSRPLRDVSEKYASTLRYYTPRIHQGAFMLPAFAERGIGL
jgi:spermidine synthase